MSAMAERQGRSAGLAGEPVGPVLRRGGAAYLLSGLLAVTATANGLLTFLVPGVLHGTAVMNGSARGTALAVLLLGVPVLAVSMALARSGSPRAVVCWLGAVGFVLYNSVLFVFATPFNRLFLLDLAMLALAAWSAGSAAVADRRRRAGWAIHTAGAGAGGRRLCVGHRHAERAGGADPHRARAHRRRAGGVAARDRPADPPRVRSGPGAVAAADRGGRRLAVAAPALGICAHRRRPCHVGPGKCQHRGGPVVRARGRRGLAGGVRGAHAGLRATGADRAGPRLLPVPQPPGHDARRQPDPCGWPCLSSWHCA